MLKKHNIIIDTLKKANIKATKERKDLFRLLLSIPHHFEINELIDQASSTPQKVSRASIYRNLPLFKKAGIVREFDTSEGKHLFEVMNEPEHHEHLTCVECHKNIEFDDSKVEKFIEKIYKTHNFIPISHKIHLSGICNKCQKKYPHSSHKNK